jgi:hypothetical protein
VGFFCSGAGVSFEVGLFSAAAEEDILYVVWYVDVEGATRLSVSFVEKVVDVSDVVGAEAQAQALKHRCNESFPATRPEIDPKTEGGIAPSIRH